MVADQNTRLADPSAKIDGAKERRHERMRMIVPGTIRLADGRVIPCMVRDLSVSGAKLRVPTNLEIPDKFQLIIPDLKVDIPVSLAWRSDSSAGVAFAQLMAIQMPNVGTH